MPASVRTLTPVLIVDAIEPVLPFWVDRLGWTVAATVPHPPDATAPDAPLGFALLVRDGVQLMYQTRASVASDVPSAAPTGPTTADGTGLFIEVDDLDAVAAALGDLPLVLPRRRTFYGMEELGVREPGGRIVTFARPIPAPGDTPGHAHDDGAHHG